MPTTTGKATDFITFSRASLATVTDSDGKIKWARHNLLTNSESFDAAAWAKVASTITANSTVAPNGTTTADTYKEDNTLSQHQITQSTPIPVGLNAVRVYAKLGSGSRYLQMRPSGLGTGVAYANFDLSTGVVVPSGTGGTAFVSASVTPSSNGFYLCEMVVNFTSAAPGIMFQLSNGTGENTAYTGDNTSSIILWGAHVYRSDLGGMVANTSAYPMYNPTTPKNLLGYTENFSNAAWPKTNILAFGSGSVANAVVALNGLQTADLIVPNTTSGAHNASQVITSAVSGTTYIASIYVKPFGYAKFGIRENAATGAYATFNLSGAGSVIAQGSGGTGAITALSDGWYRVSMSSAAGSTSFQSTFFVLDNAYSSGNPFGYNWSGDGISGIYLWGAQLSDSASLDTYVPNYFAAPTAAAYHGPRLDYSASGSALGLLVEEQRTNLLLRSDDFGTNWSLSNSALTANSAVSPDGATNGDKLITNSAASNGQVFQSVAKAASAITYTSTIFAKAGEWNTVGIYVSDSASFSNRADINVNLATGTISSAATARGTFTAALGTVTAVGNGWYRVSLTFTSSTETALLNRIYSLDSVAATGNGTSGIFIWGAQLEAGSFATSYIPTGASTVTRSADVASVATSAFPYSASVGSIVVGWRAGQNSSTAARVIWMDDTDTGVYDNFVTIRQGGNVSTAGAEGAARVNAGTATTAIATSPTITVGSTYKAGFAFAANDFALSVNGQAPVTNGSGAVPSGLDLMRIGGHRDGTYINGHIRQITYIPRRLSNAELQARTL